ncbi:hypothetical protein FB45DRAFT_859766 [Roridomyces roridus]|uniref:F-box domain-containing protein n=1 Tax=Roridomyces roridus TaxID=1738132 RepID=A0AAD7CN83_9AGAR|nr:hypothetical protein FB45DRAFT_859766 [Roridomyces roridus]
MATLPLELEREIFELVAYSQPLFVPTLSLVAKRVKAWVENLLYRVVVASDPNAITYEMPCPDFRASQIKNLPPSVLRNSVRHLFLHTVPEEGAKFLLSHCENLDDLWISAAYPSLLDIAGALPLRRLSCALEDFFQAHQAAIEEPRIVRVDWTHPLFSHLTHLEIYSPPEQFHDLPAGLASLPNLTHLSLSSGIDDSLLQLAPTIFRMCGNRLRILVFSTDGIPYPHNPELAEEVRFVQINYAYMPEDWLAGALTGADFWSRAEEFVALRLTGQVELYYGSS